MLTFAKGPCSTPAICFEFGVITSLTSPCVSLHIIYRTSGAENLNRRPGFYSKIGCAASLRSAFEKATDADLIVINDGLRSPALDVLRSVAVRVIEQERRGNSGSYRRALEVALEYPDSDWVYFVEDDYLHAPDAIAVLQRGIRGLPSSAVYLSLYEHPNMYQAGLPADPDYIYLVGSDYWRTATSTCMTFAAQVGALREGAQTHRRASAGSVPDDYGLWLALQGAEFPMRLGARVSPRLRPFLYRAGQRFMAARRSPYRRQLVVSLPSRCTHADLSDGLAPGVDWGMIAEMASRSLTPSASP